MLPIPTAALMVDNTKPLRDPHCSWSLMPFSLRRSSDSVSIFRCGNTLRSIKEWRRVVACVYRVGAH